jgi:nucleotide-binding universal stress UspA family protein
MFERILVAFDGTPPSRNACQVTLGIAAQFHSTVTVATVHPPSKEPTDGHLESLVPIDSEGKSLAILIDELKEEAQRRKIPSLEAVFLQGDVTESLLAFLREHPHDLVVTGSRGLSRGRRLLLGSVSSELVDGAPCPVLVVRPGPAQVNRAANRTTGSRAPTKSTASPGAPR